MSKSLVKPLLKFVWAFLLLSLVINSPTMAQDDPYQKYRILLAGVNIVNISWSPNSDSLNFQIEDFDNQANGPINGPYTPGTDYWHRYFVATKQITRSETWALQPSLTTQQYQTYGIYINGDDRSFIFPSPNGRYFVYSAELPVNSMGHCCPLGITDQNTNTQRIFDTNEGVFRNNFLGNFEAYKVQWSDDSSAFTLESLEAQGVYYFSQLNDLSTLSLTILARLPLGNGNYQPNRNFDISANGSQLLLYRSGGNDSIFALWNVSAVTGTVIPVQGRVVGAVFTHNDQRVLYIDEAGLKQYDIATNQVTLLDPAINSIWGAGGAYFSPDGRYVAIVRGDPESIYIFDIGGTNLALFRTDTLQANLLQTLDTNPAAIDYYTYATGVPSGATNGQWVMGDWDGDGVETPGVYGPNGVFYHTNALGPSSSWQGTWFGLLTGTAGKRPVAGRFDASINHDCIGVTDSSDFPPYGTAFALYFTCNLAGGNPPKTFQWLSVLLPDNQGHSGVWEFSAGNFDPTVDAVDTIACRRGNFITWTNTPPTTQNAAFPYAQYIGAPHSGTSQFVVGDWNSDGTDSFGLYYAALGRLRGRNDLDWNSGLYPIDQQLDTSVVGTTNVSATTWRLR